MYNYYRDNAGMMPMQNPGLLPAQNANVMPVQNTGLMPMSNMDIMPSANIMPMQNMGLMPSANVMPMHNAGLMPAANVMPMCNPCNPMAMMPAQFNQFAEMPTEDLENLYPQTYNVIMPVVESTCDNWMGGQGTNARQRRNTNPWSRTFTRKWSLMSRPPSKTARIPKKGSSSVEAGAC